MLAFPTHSNISLKHSLTHFYQFLTYSRAYDNPSIRWYSHSALNCDNIADNDVCNWNLFLDAVSDYVADFREKVFEATNHLKSNKKSTFIKKSSNIPFSLLAPDTKKLCT